MMLTLAIIIEALTSISIWQLVDAVDLPEKSHLHLQAILERQIVGGEIDSRQVIPGALFIALQGENTDGHEFVQDAFKNGAWLAITQRDLSDIAPVIDLRQGVTLESLVASLIPLGPNAHLCLLVEDCLGALQKIAAFWRNQLNVRIIGITGSVGKSTTKEVVADVLSRRFQVLKSPGNLNNEIGLPLTLLSLTEAHEYAVLEMGFYVSGEIAFLCELSRPQIGVITMIGTVHSARAGSIEAIASGKAELIKSLPPSPDGIAILNYDDPWARRMAGQTQARVFFYGLSSEANLWADEIEGLGLDGIGFRLHYRNEILHLRVPLIGRHSVHTALRATAVGLVTGLGWQEIVDGLRSDHTQLRLVTVRSQVGALILDDTYNASPESTLAALNLLEELDGKKVAVLGDMLELGQYEQEGHEAVGARAAEVVDELVTLGERGKIIAQAAWRAGLSRKKINTFVEIREAIDYLRGCLAASDVVLIKGSRGMQMDRIVIALEAQS